MIRTLMIEGFPVCFGEGPAPSWYEGEKVDALGDFEDRPVITQNLNNSLGGVAETGDVAFNLVDSDRQAWSNSRPLASIFRFLGENPLRIDGPDPLYYNETTIEVERTTHGYKKALRVPNTATGQDVSAWLANLPETWTICINFKASATYNTSNYLFNAINTAGTERIGIWYYGVSRQAALYVKRGGVQNYITLTTANISVGGDHWICARSTGTHMKIYDGDGHSYEEPQLHPNTPFNTVNLFSYSAGLSMSGDAYSYKIYSEALTDGEILDVQAGKPVDKTLIFDSDMAPWSGGVIWDRTGNQNHVGIPSGASFVARNYVAGDLLYAPSDTMRITGISGSDLTVERQVYSCLEDGYCAYYAALPYNEVGGSAYVCYAQEDYPQHYPGRLVAYYEGGETPQHLKYLGFMKTPTQRGRSWSIETTHILKPLRDGFSQVTTNVTLQTNGAASAWWVGNPSFDAVDADGAIQQSLSFEGLKTIQEIDTAFQTLGRAGSWTFSPGMGFLYLGSTPPTATASREAKGLWDVCLSGDEFMPTGYGTYHSSETGLRPYGFIFGNDSGESYMTIETAMDPWNLKRAWLKVLDQGGEEYFLKCDDVNYSTGEIQLQGPYDTELNYMPHQTFGVHSSAPITLQTAQIVTASSLPKLILRLLASTGDGSNGMWDDYPGWIGLGLPDSLIDDTLLTLGNDWPIKVNLSDADLSGDLQFVGLTLIWDQRAGKFRVVRVRPPIAALAGYSIENDDLSRGDPINVSWGHVAPVSSFSFETINGTLTATAQLPSMWPGAELNEIALKSSTGARIADANLMITDVVDRLRWLSNYAPVITLNIPGNTYQIGDQVLISASNIAGAGYGSYSVTSLPGIVLGHGKGPATDWVQVQLNTRDTTDLGSWVPSWEIASYTGATVTLAKGGALLLDDIWPSGYPTLQIIDSEGTVLDTPRTIASITSDSVIVLNAAPTYTQAVSRGIITLLDYTSASSTDQAKYVWAASTGGVMSNADPGKKLT